MAIKVIVELQAKLGKRAELTSLLESVEAKFGSSQPGFLGSTYYEVLDNTDIVVEIADWESAEVTQFCDMHREELSAWCLAEGLRIHYEGANQILAGLVSHMTTMPLPYEKRPQFGDSCGNIRSAEELTLIARNLAAEPYEIAGVLFERITGELMDADALVNEDG